MSRHTPSMAVMVAAARKAARGLQRDFGEVENLQVSLKGPANFVTAADKKAEKVIFQELSKARPGYGFLMEEGGVVEGADKSHRWIIDPLDGTTNFLHGIPMFAISIALEREGQLVAGLVYNPISDEMFIAEKGQGAFLNDRRLRVSARREMDQAVVATGIPHIGRPDHERFSVELNAVMNEVAGIRRMGAASLDLAYVAAGRFDAYWEANLAAWDIAAGIVLVREAGGFVADFNGRDDMLNTGGIVAGNDMLSRKLGDVLKKARKPA
ncbi:Inositol-phosphate phosphatase [Parvibaculum lavamentivorans DS-1]|uniref:Inositol-1-monophosphatase n=1 Tax=Parvibaculum lavamentivorans (strain DS-1 / DSM 13023 / NCIMB 13966) TaxID=402881 RepID=A7HUY2_PARL1|nr:inositol monophosphatase family protein [Parvibaculum lavamentivorans]ABS63715.1 Inositol-phosphate phosphatase [Parvibaculum lavamentivorans DS-1]